MAATATASTSFKRKIVAFFRPEILMTLSLRPASCASAAFKIGQDRLLPRIEALAMHKLTDRAVLVVANNLDRIMQGVHSNKRVTAQTFARRCAATNRTLVIVDAVVDVIVLANYEIVVHLNGVVTSGRTYTVVVSEATTSSVTVAVAPRGHGSQTSDLKSRCSRFS